MKLNPKMMAEAKDHYTALEGIAEQAGMSIDALLNKVMGAEVDSEEEEMTEPVDSEEEEGDEKPPVDRGRVSLLVAKMKGMKAKE